MLKYTKRKRPITTWYKYNPTTKEFEYNHFDYGHLGYIYVPTPIPRCSSFKNQVRWKHGVWKRKFGYIVNNKITEKGELF